MTTPIIIEEYDPQWPQRFDAIRSRIAPVLGTFAAAIEHIGSTAVPGLAAKPIIDIDVLLKSAKDLPRVITKLKAVGYQHQGTLGVPGRHAFKAPEHDVHHHLYICSTPDTEFFRHIAFRDYLRTHPKDAEDYARLKRSLAGKFSVDRETYTHAKTDFIQEILRRADLENKEHSPRATRTIS
jgi:GrpB-like predicted nucleotidyltransferase (UPF0157 family)